MALASYFPEGPVEARRDADSEWESATLTRIDREDDVLPYGVRWASSQDFDWVRVDQIRLPVAEQPRVKQYRFRQGSRWLDWTAYTDDAVIPIMHAYTAVQFREVAPRTEAEVLAELRKYTGEQRRRGNSVDPRFARILEGNF